MQKGREDDRQMMDNAQHRFFVETHRLREELWAGCARIRQTADSQERELLESYRLLFRAEEEILRSAITETIMGATMERKE